MKRDVCLVWKTTDSQTFCTTFVPLTGNAATGVLLRLILISKEVNSIGFYDIEHTGSILLQHISTEAKISIHTDK